MSDIQMTSLRYHGDHPQDYENKGYKGDDDVEAGGRTSQESPYEAVDLKDGDPPSKEKPPKYDELGASRSGSYGFQNNNADPVRDAESDDDEDEDDNCCLGHIRKAQHGMSAWCKVNHKQIRMAILIILLLAYFAYFGYAMYHEHLSNEGSIRLCWVTCWVVFWLLVILFWRFCGEKIMECCKPCTSKLAKHEALISWLVVAALFLAIIVFVFVDVFVNTKQPYNLVSGSGIIIYVLLFFIFSVSPAKVQWRTVAWGLCLQFIFAILILRWRGGYIAFQWLGARVSEFLDYTDVGSAFIFGDIFREHYFAFKVLPTIIFFSTAISILYYLGVMQVIVFDVAFVMQHAMGTTAAESLNAAGNIFVGQTEAPLMIRPLLPSMTPSELHAVMTGGFATIAGGVLAAYIGFGVPANHLISASVMSAPAALAMSKLFYPETKISKTKAKDMKDIPKSDEVNIIAAASTGASQSIKLVANVAVNLIAFLSLLAFINATLTWFGNRVGLDDPPLTFELICSYVLFPFSFIMGVDLADCRQVAELIGVKTFLNEFIAYDRLGKIIANREILEEHIFQNGTWDYRSDSGFDIVLNTRPGFNETILDGGIITVRSEVIATYALCGFANIGSIGIQLGGLGAMAPERAKDLARVAFRAMIAGNVACFMTACIAGLFFQG